MSLTAVIQLDEAHNQMYFPIAESATDVQLGGNNATVTKGNSSTLVDISKVKSLPKDKVLILTTGSQGEEMSALYRMAFSTHKQVELGAGDKVIISASAIPGNEVTVGRVINELFRKGVKVGMLYCLISTGIGFVFDVALCEPLMRLLNPGARPSCPSASD